MMHIYPVQVQKVGLAAFPTLMALKIIYLAVGLLIFAGIFTIAAHRHPSGPLPAAYGHLQTLADLVDEWSVVMWWGHKETGPVVSHAGTL